MKTQHTIRFAAATALSDMEPGYVDLVVTSPPYPMIEMWDTIFGELNPDISVALADGDGSRAFELMHTELDDVWVQLHRVLRDGGIACINVGDSTRSLGNDFRLYANHARIVQKMNAIGFSSLPEILWRKQTNAPNKFMGSGMLPAGAYVTLEHEFILVFRKGGKREFIDGDQKQNRRHSALFWEERNNWFSDLWMDVKGVGQELGQTSTRARSAAYPFELAYRLINMFSVFGDQVLDPFLGTGTTTAAAMVSARNSYGFERDKDFRPHIELMRDSLMDYANSYLRDRLQKHLAFVSEREWPDKAAIYTNHRYGFPVVTRQEQEICFHELVAVCPVDVHGFEVSYDPLDLPVHS